MFFHLKPLTALVSAGLLGVVLSVSAQADTAQQKSARATIAAAYQKAARALMLKDLAPIAAIEAADYQDFSARQGTVNREEDLARLRASLALVKSVLKAETRIQSLTWRGPDAVVMSENTTVLLVPRNGQLARVETVNLSRDYWSRTAQGWQMRQSVSRLAKTWINGKRAG